MGSSEYTHYIHHDLPLERGEGRVAGTLSG